MSVPITVLDLISMVGFIVAVVYIIRVPAPSQRLVNGSSKVFIVAAMALYSFVMFTNVLEHSGITAYLDQFEDYAEILFPPLVLYSVHTMYTRQQLNDLARSEHLTRVSHDMMMNIVDTTPAGILVLESNGWISYANERARELLGLFDSPETGRPDRPGWVVIDRRPGATGEGKPDFSAFISDKEVKGVPVTVEWPNSWRRHIRLSVTSMGDVGGGVGGAVAAFIERAPSHD